VAKRPARTENRADRAPGRAGTTLDFNPDYSYVRADLRRIAYLAAAFISLLVILKFVID
jgi:hypothetical protein